MRPLAEVNGRLENHDGLRILRVWGTPDERGYAHGVLLGKEVVAMARAEFAARFAKKPGRMEQIHKMLERMVRYPENVEEEMRAMYRGVKETVADLRLDEFDRDLMYEDLLVANALDIFAPIACSGMTVWGDKVVGGGVLTTRNFDWPYTGKHMVDDTLVLVEHPSEGAAFACITWPGYLGGITAVNERGLAVFLHVGSGRITIAPEPESYPTAIAAREILRTATVADAREVGARLIAETSPPISYISRLVLPRIPKGSSSPTIVFEADARKEVVREVEGYCVVTNHFLGRDDGRSISRDSQSRFDKITAGVEGNLSRGDRKISVAEAWESLSSVERGERRAFGTLHSLVFRGDPWVFELAIGTPAEGGMVRAATRSERRYSVPKKVLFKSPTGEGQ